MPLRPRASIAFPVRKAGESLAEINAQIAQLEEQIARLGRQLAERVAARAP
jgi:uncharacterized small protein (DUF1192 family)